MLSTPPQCPNLMLIPVTTHHRYSSISLNEPFSNVSRGAILSQGKSHEMCERSTCSIFISQIKLRPTSTSTSIHEKCGVDHNNEVANFPRDALEFRWLLWNGIRRGIFVESRRSQVDTNFIFYCTALKWTTWFTVSARHSSQFTNFIHLQRPIFLYSGSGSSWHESCWSLLDAMKSRGDRYAKS